MRTTLTLDDDVAVMLERARKGGLRTLKQVVNEALRRGLRQMEEPPPPADRYETPSTSLGRCLVGSVDDVSEALTIAEGESFR
jgi:hypothetical protein